MLPLSLPRAALRLPWAILSCPFGAETGGSAVSYAPPTSLKASASVALGVLSIVLMCCVGDIDGDTPKSPIYIRRVAFSAPMLLSVTVVAVLSLVLAILALVDIRRSRGQLQGRGVAGCGFMLLLLAVLEFGGIYLLIWVKTVATSRTQSANHLKQLALAMDAYEKDHGTLPPAAIHSPAGKPLLSWRVLLLPYLEAKSLYQQFKLNEPWDSPHNMALLDKMPAVFAAPESDPSDVTYYQVFVGPGAAFEGSQGLKRTDFADGLDQTILVIEAGEPVPWTQPYDLAYTPNQRLPKVGGLRSSSIIMAFADTSVRTLPREVSEATLRALITRKAGDKPGNDFSP
jgi:hypothetical protein